MASPLILSLLSCPMTRVEFHRALLTVKLRVVDNTRESFHAWGNSLLRKQCKESLKEQGVAVPQGA